MKNHDVQDLLFMERYIHKASKDLRDTGSLEDKAKIIWRLAYLNIRDIEKYRAAGGEFVIPNWTVMEHNGLAQCANTSSGL